MDATAVLASSSSSSSPPAPPPSLSAPSPVKTSDADAEPGTSELYATGQTFSAAPPSLTPPDNERMIATTMAMPPNASDAGVNDSSSSSHNNATSGAPPPPVNAAAASAATLMGSTAMTPTTMNYGMNAQLAKLTGTLTPMGEDKVSTAGPSGTQKAKQTRKKAAADGETAKKPSPRVRAKADPNKAERRKASPARANAAAAVSTPTNTTPPTSQLPTGPNVVSPGVPVMNQQYAQMRENPTLGQHQPQQQQEMPPSQDTELRKQYLQRIYRQLQMTHRNQDDANVRRLATNIEIDICRRAPTRTDYVTLMNQQIHGLMQAELTNSADGLQSSLYVPGQAMPTSSSAMGTPVSTARMVSPGAHPATSTAFKQGSPAPNSGDAGSRTSTPNQGSFMSLLSSQAPMQSFESARAPAQYNPQMVASQRPHPFAAGSNAAGYAAQQGQGIPQVPGFRSDGLADPTAHQQQSYPGQRAPAPQAGPMTAPPEFVAQFQRLDRNALVDLLWTQHKTVIQYQRRLAQLEVQLNAQRPGTGMANPTAAPGNSGSYCTANPHQPQPASVSPSLSAEAEEHRARERANMRAAHLQQTSYGQSQYQPAQVPATPTGGGNPAVYWEKVRYLKEAYLRPLHIAHQALSQHSAPTNSTQGAKAENVKHNIGLACSILSEMPQSLQPRPLEVLDSIEKFIQSTVVPIVRKVSPQMPVRPPSSTPDVQDGHQMRPPQTHSEFMDAARAAMRTPSGTQLAPLVPPTGAPAFSIMNGSQGPSPNPVAPPAQGNAKSSAKSGTTKATKAVGKKSPANGSKKALTPKAPAAKGMTKAPGKKSPGKANGTMKQAAAGKMTPQSNGDKAKAIDVQPIENVDGVPAAGFAASSTTSPVKDSEVAHGKAGGMTDDDLNDFSDFADLDFDDDLQDPLTKISNKENTTEANSRKRSIEDV